MRPPDLEDELDSDDPKIIIAITGMPGAGKTTAAGYLVRAGIRAFSMGDAIREEVRRRGLQPGLEAQLKVMELVRRERGPAAVASLIEPRIVSADESIVAVDGVRSPEEVAHFELIGHVFVLAVHASPATRLARLRARGRDDDPGIPEDLERRDLAELEVGLGDVIARADGMIVNERITRDELGALVVEFAREWVAAGDFI